MDHIYSYKIGVSLLTWDQQNAECLRRQHRALHGSRILPNRNTQSVHTAEELSTKLNFHGRARNRTSHDQYATLPLSQAAGLSLSLTSIATRDE